MISRSIVSAILITLCVTCRLWNFEILSATATSSDANLANISLQVDRLSFSESTISGTVDWKFDSDETTMVQLLVLYSISGREEDYHELPYNAPRQTLKDFVDNYYEGVTYANLGECSNMPKFNGKFVPPWPQKTYTFHHCQLTGDGFPHILPLGYYKLWLQISGPFEVNVVGIVKLTPKFI